MKNAHKEQHSPMKEPRTPVTRNIRSAAISNRSSHAKVCFRSPFGEDCNYGCERPCSTTTCFFSHKSSCRCSSMLRVPCLVSHTSYPITCHPSLVAYHASSITRCCILIVARQMPSIPNLFSLPFPPHKENSTSRHEDSAFPGYLVLFQTCGIAPSGCHVLLRCGS
jgi:hypothetical protein